MAALAKIEFDKIFAGPPKVDISLLVVADDLKRIERLADSFERQLLTWRTKTSASLRGALQTMMLDARKIAKAEAYVSAKPQIELAIGSVEDAMRAFGTPMHADPEFAEKLETLRNLSPAAARAVRKQLRRVEKMRVTSYNFCVDSYYALLAFLSELDPDDNQKESFVDPEKLEDSLRKALV